MKRRKRQNVLIKKSNKKDYLIQFSNFSKGILENSWRLLVTKIRFSESACEAINISIAPITFPSLSNFALNSPY
ncbi:hypothetical protein EF405_19425 [Cyclobacteriaceae bacterium YHN15]|nr:hypothetical protein EF405_19425 [Cyclobacteriaceae bacterium YHN15]